MKKKKKKKKLKIRIPTAKGTIKFLSKKDKSERPERKQKHKKAADNEEF